MTNFFVSKQSNWLIATWAACEAIFWFVIPEFLLFLIVFMKVKHKTQLVTYDIVGTVIGTCIGLYISMSSQTMVHIPYIFPKMLESVHGWYQSMGIFGLINQPFSGVPYKVFVSEAHSYDFNLFIFILFAVLVRLSRYVIAYGVLLAIYPFLHRFVFKYYALLFPLGIFFFTFMLMKVSQIYG